MDGSGYFQVKQVLDRARICRICHKPCWYAKVHKRCQDDEERRDGGRVESTKVRQLTKAPRRK